jgi:transcriptional regulator with XRE-family HTH domain
MAPTIGQALLEARTERGVTLDEVERVTKIRVKFLRAMEEDRWDALPPPVYTRSFLSAYARFLDLDDDLLVDQYRRTIEPEEEDRGEPIPYQAVQPGQHKGRRPIRPVVMLLTVLLAGGVAVGLAISALGGSDGGDGDGGDRGDRTERRAGTPTGSATAEESADTTTSPTTTDASAVSLELRSTGTVWVCLVDGDGRELVNGETLTAAQERGPFASRAFEVTFGNGSVEMTVDGEPAEIPPLAEPLGYRITPGGVRELEGPAQPSCA